MTTILSTPTGAGLASSSKPESQLANGLTWATQGLVSLVFLFAGVSKFIMPAQEMAKNSPLPLGFIYFIAVCEVLGALGMVLPGLLKIRRNLTPIAAIGLTIIMLGAVAISARMDIKMAVLPFVVGLLTATVAYRRWPWLALSAARLARG